MPDAYKEDTSGQVSYGAVHFQTLWPNTETYLSKTDVPIQHFHVLIRFYSWELNFGVWQELPRPCFLVVKTKAFNLRWPLQHLNNSLHYSRPLLSFSYHKI